MLKCCRVEKREFRTKLSRVATRQFRLLTANNAAIAARVLRQCTAYVLSRFRFRKKFRFPTTTYPIALSTRSPDVRHILCQFRPCTRQLSFPTSVYFLVDPSDSYPPTHTHTHIHYPFPARH